MVYHKPPNYIAIFIIAVAAALILLLGIASIGEQQKETPVSLYEDFKEDATHAEGRVDKVYLIDGVKHAGIGHKLVGDELLWHVGTRVYEEQIDKWFQADYGTALAGAERYFPKFHEYPHLAQLAILNWLYQLGAEAPIHFPHATAAINARDWIEAANQWEYVSKAKLRKSRWYHQTPVRCMQEVERLRAVGLQEGLKP